MRKTVLLVAALGLATSAATADAQIFDTIESQARVFGAVRMAVRLKPLPAGLASAMAAEDAAVAGVTGSDVLARQAIGPNLVAVTVRPDAVGALQANPRAAEVVVDTLAAPFLLESIPIVRADALWPRAGAVPLADRFAVAVLDTGVARSPEFENRIVHEACFSSTDPGSGSRSACPNGAAEATGKGAGAPCPLDIAGCDHGTHVAAIASGARSRPEGPVLGSGVAPGAPLIAVQVFSLFHNPAVCGPRGACALSWSTDQVKAMEHVAGLVRAGRFKVAAVNMSLGSGAHAQPCPASVVAGSVTGLRGLDVATVVATGNDGRAGSIAEPACTPGVVSVGATSDGDTIATAFSNRSSFTTLMAPGENIVAAVPGGVAAKSGTSMATPHVAGAFAALRTLYPSATVDQITAALRETGRSIPDGQATFRRIAVDAAEARLRSMIGIQATPSMVPARVEAPPAAAPGLVTGADGSQRVVILGQSPEDEAGIMRALGETSGAGDILIRRLPGSSPRYSVTLPREAVGDLQGRIAREVPATRVVPDTLSAPLAQ